MSMKDIKKKNDKDLQKFLVEKREEMRSFRFNSAGSGMRDVTAMKTAKKEIAQILTEQTFRKSKVGKPVVTEVTDA